MQNMNITVVKKLVISVLMVAIMLVLCFCSKKDGVDIEGAERGDIDEESIEGEIFEEENTSNESVRDENVKSETPNDAQTGQIKQKNLPEPTEVPDTYSWIESQKGKEIQGQEENGEREITNDELFAIQTEIFSQNQISIRYPQIEGIETQEKINQLIKDHVIEEVSKTEEGLSGDTEIIWEMDYEITMKTSEILSILYRGYCDLRENSETYYYGFDIDAQTIDLANAEEMELSDFAIVDDNFAKRVKQSTQLMGGAPAEWKISENDLTVIQQNEKEKYIIRGLQEKWDFYRFCVTPETIIVSIAASHTCGDYMLIEINRDSDFMKAAFDKCLSEYNVKKSEDDEWIIYECEPIEDTFNIGISMVGLNKNFKIDVLTYQEAKSFLLEMLDYDGVRHYQKADNEYGITEIFEAYKDNESYHLIFCGDSSYLVHVQGKLHLESELLPWSWMDAVADQYSKQIVECAGGSETQIITDISYVQRRAVYEFYFNEQQEEGYMAVVQIDGDVPKKYTFTLYREQEELQKMDWKSPTESYPDFLDANADGCIDMMVVTDQAASYDMNDLYIWNNEKERFDKVIYDGILAWIEVKDDGIWNWIRNGEGYILETLQWRGNELVLVSEKEVTPE